MHSEIAYFTAVTISWKFHVLITTYMMYSPGETSITSAKYEYWLLRTTTIIIEFEF